MKCTSAEAAKILRSLSDELTSVSEMQDKSAEFVAAVGEDIESVRPSYNFAETQAKLNELEKKIRTVKHALNVFNSTTVVPEFGMTIDEMLVYIPQLSLRKRKLGIMKSKLAKTREQSSVRSGVIDYRYLNYQLADAEREFKTVEESLSAAQTALDLINSTATLEIDL